MARITPIAIPQAPTLDDLRQQVVKQANDLSRQIAKSSRRNEPMDLGNNRITSVADPADGMDAVNLNTLKRKLDDLRMELHPATTPTAPFGTSTSTGGGGAGFIGTNASQYTLTTAYADVPGLTVTLTNSGNYVIHGVFDFEYSSPDGGLQAQFVLGGVTQQGTVIMNNTGEFTLSRTWLAKNVAANTVAKFQARKTSGTSTSFIAAGQGAIIATQF